MIAWRSQPRSVWRISLKLSTVRRLRMKSSLRISLLKEEVQLTLASCKWLSITMKFLNNRLHQPLILINSNQISTLFRLNLLCRLRSSLSQWQISKMPKFRLSVDHRAAQESKSKTNQTWLSREWTWCHLLPPTNHRWTFSKFNKPKLFSLFPKLSSSFLVSSYHSISIEWIMAWTLFQTKFSLLFNQCNFKVNPSSVSNLSFTYHHMQINKLTCIMQDRFSKMPCSTWDPKCNPNKTESHKQNFFVSFTFKVYFKKKIK